MKTLFLVRHAKSSWKDSSLSDIERPLNERGRKSAGLIGDLLSKRNTRLDRMYTSPANRALSTARLLAGSMNYPVDSIRVREELYEGSIGRMLSVIRDTPADIASVMLIGHNPAIQLLAEQLSPFEENAFPTCAVLHLEFEMESWESIDDVQGSIRAYEYPKKYRKE